MNRNQGWWMVVAGLALAPGVWAQTAWTPMPAAAKAARPAHLAVLDDLPADSVAAYRRQETKAGGHWEFVLPDGQALRIAAVHAQTHVNGDVTWSGYVESAGGNYPMLLTQGEHASFGSFSTPRGRYRLEGWDDRAWVVREDHVQIDLPAPDEFALAAPAGTHPGKVAQVQPQPAAPKADATQIDVLFIYTASLAARYPGTAVQTRVNHLAAVANQAFANSNVAAAVRVVGVEAVEYRDDNTNAAAIDDVRKAVQPNGIPVLGLLTVQNLRDTRGADLVTLIRPHDLEIRGTCGVGYLFEDAPNLGLNVISDGISGWSICRDETFAHEVGHNLGLQHQDGANNGDAGGATAFVAPGRFHTLMGSFATGDDQRARTLLRFSNPEQRCGGIPCGVAGVSDNAGRARATMNQVAAFLPTTGSTPAAVVPPPALDADVDGDGVKESLDAFPFDAAYSSDRDNDGVADQLDRFADNPAESADTDNDGIGDNADLDLDGDGTPNGVDALPRLASESTDADEDGVGDNADVFDTDRREWGDFDGDTRGDNADPDVDNDGVDTQGVDLLVASLGTDRVIRLDGASGRFIAVEIAEPGHDPYALGPESALAWNPYRRRVDALIASDVRRYDGASRKREAVVLESMRGGTTPGLLSGLSAAFTVAPDGTLYVADANAKTLHRFDAVTGAERPESAFGDTRFFTLPPRALTWHNNLLWTLEKNGRLATVDAHGVVSHLSPPVGGAGIPFPLLDPTAFVFGNDGQAYIADGARDLVYRMNPQTGQLAVFIAVGSGGLDRPSGLAFDEQGRLYVSSAGNNKVLRYAADGSFVDSFAKVPAGLLADPRSLLFVPRIADRFPRDATRRIRPNVGAWYDQTRSGQGFDIQDIGNNVFSVAWYTYEADGRATWYLATGPMQGNELRIPLQRVTWNGSAAAGTPVGELALTFSAHDRAVLNWKLGTQSGGQNLVHFQTGDSMETQFPTAVWYAPASTGWGFSLTRLGGVQSITAFVFDKNGNPTWVTGVGSPDDTEFTLRRLEAPNGCPGCSGNTAPTATAIGTATFDVSSDTNADGAISLQSSAVEWQYPALELIRATATPTLPNGDPR